ncbi:aminodeoxychorismate/anthranilate synthase component II [Deltaproteobacteria bacterium]|nr:aminodeoxychorismate/anthranilate synthase component II [Deltaproteobacteria bacterium]
MRVLVVDNLDSFTWSLVQLLQTLGAATTVVRDKLPLNAGVYDLALLSPGPGRPEDHPALVEAMHTLSCPIFGVCLGMQAIVLHFGGSVVPARQVVHGRTSAIHHDHRSFFAGIPSPFRATRYHSLATTGLPDSLEVLAHTADGEIMAVRHRERPIAGVQFHPESVRTEHGLALMGGALRELTAQR